MLQNGDIYGVQVYCYYAGVLQVGINNYAYQVTNTVGLGIFQQEFADELSVNFAALYKPLLSSAVSYWGVRVARKFVGATPLASFSAVGRGLGTVDSGILPGQVSGLLRKGTAFGGKSYRGRDYIPFPPTSMADGLGRPLAAYVTNLNALAVYVRNTQTIIVAPNNNTVMPVLLHKSTLPPTKIESAEGSNRFATQRKRGFYGATNAPPF